MGKHGAALISFLGSHLPFSCGLIAWHPTKHLYSGSAEAVGSRKCKESTRHLLGVIRPATKWQVPFLSHFSCNLFIFLPVPNVSNPRELWLSSLSILGGFSILSTTWTIQCHDDTCWGKVNEANAPEYQCRPKCKFSVQLDTSAVSGKSQHMAFYKTIDPFLCIHLSLDPENVKDNTVQIRCQTPNPPDLMPSVEKKQQSRRTHRISAQDSTWIRRVKLRSLTSKDKLSRM